MPVAICQQQIAFCSGSRAAEELAWVRVCARQLFQVPFRHFKPDELIGLLVDEKAVPLCSVSYTKWVVVLGRIEVAIEQAN